VLYTDFESIIKPDHGCKPNPKESFITLNAKHISCGFCIHLKSAIAFIDSQLADLKLFVYRGLTGESTELVVETFLKMTRPNNIKPIIMTSEDNMHLF